MTEQAQADVDELVDAAVEFALMRIRSAGGFLPFALAVFVGGQIEDIQPNSSGESQLEIADQIAARWRDIAESRDSLRAAAVAVNVTLTEANRDGIEINVEHREGLAIGVIFPYTVGANGAYQLEAPSVHQENARIWAV